MRFKISQVVNAGNALTAVLLLCAVLVTASVVHREFGGQPRQFHIARHLSKWQYLVKDRHLVGNADAPIKIIEFVDYECPACRDLEPKLKKAIQKQSRRFALVRYSFPLSKIHPHAYDAAVAAKCAARQGIFGRYREALFQNGSPFENPDFVKLAARSGIRNIGVFKSCVRQEATADLIKADRETGKRLNIRGTPTLIINGDVIPGTHSKAELDALLSYEYQKSTKSGFWTTVTRLFD
jgi:protein-disulfide isomerase